MNSPRRGIGQTSQGRIVGYANTLGEPVWDVAAAPEAVPGLAPAAVKAVGRFMSVMERLSERAEAGAGVGDLLHETLEETGYVEALQAERTIEAQGRLENLEELVGVGREYDAAAGGRPREGRSVEQFLQQVALFSEQDQLRDDEGIVTLMTIHNAKGLEYDTLSSSAWRTACSRTCAPSRRATSRRSGASPTWDHARPARALPEPRALAQPVRRARLEPAQPLHRRDPDRPHRPRGGRGHRAGGGSHVERRRGRARRARARAPPSRSATTWSTRTSARAWSSAWSRAGSWWCASPADGSERKLMADYAPLKKRG